MYPTFSVAVLRKVEAYVLKWMSKAPIMDACCMIHARNVPRTALVLQNQLDSIISSLLLLCDT